MVFVLNTNAVCRIISKGWNANIDIHTFQINGTENFNQLNINTNGYVGIETSKPDSELTVNGTIHSKEIKGDVNFPVPDYVFTNDYRLKTIEEVEKYVKENSHLPEVPSALEMEKEGIKLSEMNMTLLKKNRGTDFVSD